MTLQLHDFDGVTYDPNLDKYRLNKQLRAVYDFMQGGEWYTLRDIATATGYPEASISARLRDLRKPRFGGHYVDKRRIEHGLWKYRLIIRP